MTASEATAAIIDVLRDREYDVPDPCPDTTTFEEIGLDSLDKVELVQLVEDYAGGELSREQFQQIKTIHHLAEALANE